MYAVPSSPTTWKKATTKMIRAKALIILTRQYYTTLCGSFARRAKKKKKNIYLHGVIFWCILEAMTSVKTPTGPTLAHIVKNMTPEQAKMFFDLLFRV